MKSVVLGLILTVFSTIFYTNISHAKYVGICSDEKIVDSKTATHSRVIRGQKIHVLCPSRIPTPKINNSPIWFQAPVQKVFIGGGLQFVVSALDPDHEKLNYSVLNLPNGALFDSESRTFTWIPEADQAGVHTINFRVSDKLFFADMKVEIDVYPRSFSIYPIQGMLNFFSIRPPSTINAEELYITTLQVNGGTDLFYRVVNGPEGLVIDRGFGVVYWIPNKDQGRQEPYLVTVGVNNGKVEVLKSFYIQVKDAWRSPYS